MLRNSAPLSVDVIITQHLLLCWNTDEQQERGNGGTIKRGGGEMCTQGACVSVCARASASRMRTMPSFIHQLLVLPDICHTAAAAGQQIRQGQKDKATCR